MCNLFSIFDPSLRVGKFSLLSIVVLIFFPFFYYSYRMLRLVFFRMFNFLKTEIEFRLSNIKKGVFCMFFSTFILIVSLNFFALFPHYFSTTSHLIVTFPLAYGIWVGIVFFNIYSFFSYFLSHFIPVGTPLFLVSFIVVVEILSNLIRPIALTFRLTANIIAGHLLMALVGGGLLSLSSIFFTLGSIIQILLVLMEIGVSLIQAYVFFTLLFLYLSEGDY